MVSGSFRRIVVKLGTNLLTGGTSCLNDEIMSSLTSQMAELHHKGTKLVLVSSGAIAAGRFRLGIEKDKHGIPFKQVLAAVGQSRLMHSYEQLFARYDITIAQALLTKTDLADRTDYLNARNTLLALMDLGVICVVNENDVVAVDEIQEAKFGDNDNLSAMVANLVDADLLLILTDTGGLCTADPRSNSEYQRIVEVGKIDANIWKLAKGTGGLFGTGGMITKVEAAKLATDSGITVIIADGYEPNIICRIARGEKSGTLFQPATTRRDSRKRWMLSGLSTRGKIILDGGAISALQKSKRSLLAAGISSVEGRFKRGDSAKIVDELGNLLGYGISNYSSDDIATIKGAHSKQIVKLLGYDYGSEVVHRNNLVII
jgi:glutamate 5-kinase